MHYRFLFFASIFISGNLFFSACKDDSEINAEKLIGYWELKTGKRNQKETESLMGTTFSFDKEGKMRTNLPVGIESPADFEVKNNEISQKGRQTIQYKIIQFSDSILTLGLEMRGSEFEMVLHRTNPPPVDTLLQ